MDSDNRHDVFIDYNGEYQTRRCKKSSSGDCLPPIREEPNDKFFGHHSVSYLDVGRGQSDPRRAGTHGHTYVDRNTFPNGLEDEHWDDYIRPSKASKQAAFQEPDFLETPSLIERSTTNSAEGCSEASLSGEGLDCKPAAVSAFEKTQSLGPSSFRKEISFQIKKSLASSQQRNQFCCDITPKTFHHHHHHQQQHQQQHCYWDQEPPKSTLRSTGPTIEIAPGEFRRLRGAAETWKAIQVDFYVPCTCLVCNQTVFCIQDADFVLCPTCRAVSPVQDGADDISEEAGAGRAAFGGGVGLGFTFDDLAKWQEEIAATRAP